LSGVQLDPKSLGVKSYPTQKTHPIIFLKIKITKEYRGYKFGFRANFGEHSL